MPQQIQIKSSITAKQGKRNACGSVERQTRKKKVHFTTFSKVTQVQVWQRATTSLPERSERKKIERQLTIAILELFSIIVLKMMHMEPL